MLLKVSRIGTLEIKNITKSGPGEFQITDQDALKTIGKTLGEIVTESYLITMDDEWYLWVGIEIPEELINFTDDSMTFRIESGDLLTG